MADLQNITTQLSPYFSVATMPTEFRATLTEQSVDPALAAIVHEVLTACDTISQAIRQGALAGILGEAGSDNVQGEHQKKLDVVANDILLAAGLQSGQPGSLSGHYRRS